MVDALDRVRHHRRALPAEAAAVQMPVTAQAVWRALHPNGRTAT
jgi:hypothetical protein